MAHLVHALSVFFGTLLYPHKLLYVTCKVNFHTANNYHDSRVLKHGRKKKHPKGGGS